MSTAVSSRWARSTTPSDALRAHGAPVGACCVAARPVARPPQRRRDRGSAVVATLTFSFVFMAGAFIWLSRTVDRSLHDRSQATAVAFQGARAGAQQIDEEASRAAGGVVVDTDLAVAAARASVARALAANGDSGAVTAISVDGDQVTVTVVVSTSGRSMSGTATATAHFGFDAADQ